MNFSALGAGQKKRGAGPCGNVLDMHHRQAFSTEGSQQLRRLIRSRLGAYQLHRAAGEVVVLNIDEDECSGHKNSK